MLYTKKSYSSVTPKEAESVVDESLSGIVSSVRATALSVSSSHVAFGKRAVEQRREVNRQLVKPRSSRAYCSVEQQQALAPLHRSRFHRSLYK
jgi:hypothetical protein